MVPTTSPAFLNAYVMARIPVAMFPFNKWFIEYKFLNQHVQAVGVHYAHQECSYGSDKKSCIFKCIWHGQNSSCYVSLHQMDHSI